MRSFFAAIGFLTIFPVPSRVRMRFDRLERTVVYFPLVGLLLGSVTVAADYGLSFLFPSPVRDVLAVTTLFVFSGGLHFDGLMDTADGFLSTRPRDKILKIMRDSRTGSMALLVGILVIATKIFSLSALDDSLRSDILLLTPLAGRVSVVIMMVCLPYARVEGGFGTPFLGGASRLAILFAISLLVGTGWFFLNNLGLALSIGVVVFSLLFCLYSFRKIGGYTGDTLGASSELIECIPCLIALLWRQVGL